MRAKARTGESGRILLAVVAAVLLGAVSARATSLGTVQLQYVDAFPATTATVYLDGAAGEQLAGVYHLAVNPAAGSYSLEGVDLVRSIMPLGYRLTAMRSEATGPAPASGAWTTYDILAPREAPAGLDGSPLGAERAWDLSRLFNLHYQAWYGADDPDAVAAAFQLAVWEIFYETDGGYDVTSGVFSAEADGLLADLANPWLRTLGDGTPNVGLRVLANPLTQDYAIAVTCLGSVAPETTAVPEPLTVLAVLLGTGGLGRYVRRRIS